MKRSHIEETKNEVATNEETANLHLRESAQEQQESPLIDAGMKKPVTPDAITPEASSNAVVAQLAEEQAGAKSVPKAPKQSVDFSGPLWQSLLIFLIPLILSNTLQSIGGTVSSILLGRFIGEYALAAASNVFPVIFFLTSFILGIGSASSVMIGQAYGSGNTERMKATVGTSLSFSFLIGVALAIIGSALAPQLISLIGTPESIVEPSTNFSRIIFIGMPFMFMYINYTTFLRGTGDSKTPLYFLFVSTSLNILLTIILVPGWWGIPQMGVEGAALAMVLSTVATFFLLLIFLARIKHPLALDRSTVQKLRMDGQIMRLMIKIGLPTSIQMIFVSLSAVAVISLVNHFGAQATAAYGAVNQIITYVQMPAMSLGMAAGIFGSQLIGAKLQSRMGELIKSAVILNYVLGAVLVGIVYLFSHTVLSLFLTDQSTLAIAEALLNIVLWSYVIFGNSTIITGIMRSSGTVLWPTIIGIFSIWGVQLPVAYLLAGKLGLSGIWIAYPIAFTFSLAAQYVYYRLFWRNKVHKQFF